MFIFRYGNYNFWNILQTLFYSLLCFLLLYFIFCILSIFFNFRPLFRVDKHIFEVSWKIMKIHKKKRFSVYSGYLRVHVFVANDDENIR